MRKKKKVLVTGGSGRFGIILKKLNYKNYVFPSKKQLDITNIKSIERSIKEIKPKLIIHLAGLSRPLSAHERNPINSINLNIVGTSNLVMVAKKYNIKPAEVGISWLIHKGANPIIGVTKESHLLDAINATDNDLVEDDLLRLESSYTPRKISELPWSPKEIEDPRSN